MQEPKQTIEFLVKMLRERDRQDDINGGPDHDDLHSLNDFVLFIDKQLFKAEMTDDYKEQQERLIKAAALVMAAYQSNKRKNNDAIS